MADKSVTNEFAKEQMIFEKSPFIRGLISGAKGAILGGAAGAAVQAIQGKDVLSGALLGALGTGILSGVAKTAIQDVANQETEATLRYHAERIRSREPYFFLPRKGALASFFRAANAGRFRISEQPAGASDHSDNMRPTLSG